MMDGFDMSSGGWITMVLVWMVLVLIVIWAVRLLRPVPGGEQPLEVLDRRLARGEIDAATYDQLRAKLTGTAPGPPGGPTSATR